MKAYYVNVNIYRSSSHSTLEATTYRPIYNNTFMIGSSNVRARDYSITGSRIHISLKHENNGILPNYRNISTLPEIGNTISKYIEA
jgi:hypothetical protein